MAVTERRDPQELQVMKYSLFSPLLSSVSGDLQVLQVTYSTAIELASDLPRRRNSLLGKLTDISPQDVLDLLLLETTLDNQSPASVHGTARSQLSEQV